jgi:hypothetical protein
MHVVKVFIPAVFFALLLTGCASEKILHPGPVFIAQQVSAIDSAQQHYVSRKESFAAPFELAIPPLVPTRINRAIKPLQKKRAYTIAATTRRAPVVRNLDTAAKRITRADKDSFPRVCAMTFLIGLLAAVVILLLLALKALGVNPTLALVVLGILVLISMYAYMRSVKKRYLT